MRPGRPVRKVDILVLRVQARIQLCVRFRLCHLLRGLRAADVIQDGWVRAGAVWACFVRSVCLYEDLALPASGDEAMPAMIYSWSLLKAGLIAAFLFPLARMASSTSPCLSERASPRNGISFVVPRHPLPTCVQNVWRCMLSRRILHGFVSGIFRC